MTAKPEELRLMLIDGAIRFTEQARRGYETKDYEAAYTGTQKSQAILLEIIGALRPEHAPDLCKQVAALYTYMFNQLVKASSTREISAVDEVLRLLRYERETWVMCMDQLARENHAASRMNETPRAVPAMTAPHQDGKSRPSIMLEG